MQEDPAATRPRDARISYTLALVSLVVGLTMIALGAYSSMPGSCGYEAGCPGGRDATPLTGIGLGSIMVGTAYAAWRKGRSLSQAAPGRG